MNEIAELKKELKKELDEHEEFTKKANDEIERLTNEANQDTITHIYICTENFSLRREITEIQKQVDELKGKVKDQQREVRMARGFCIHEKRRTEHAKVLANCKNKIGLAEQKRQYKRGYDKAVKDTAKEVADKIQELLDTPFEGKTEKQEYQRKGMEDGLKMALEIVRECKGVEVE